MGYTDTNASRQGSLNGAADKWSLFLKVFSGEVLSLFEQKTVMKPLITTRSISVGKSAAFPLYGSLGAKFHVPGQNLLETGNGYVGDMKFAERVLNIDGQLISAAFVADIDDMLNHWDVRGPIATQIARELAYYFDKAAMQTMLAAARTSSSPVTYKTSGGQDLVGTQITATGAGFSPGDFITAAYAAAAALDNKDVPSEDRFIILNPTNYWKLVLCNSPYVQSRDYSEGNSNVAKGVLHELAGMRLIKSGFIPNSDQTADADGTSGNPLSIDAKYSALSGDKGTTVTTVSGANVTTAMPNHSIKNDPFGGGNGYIADFSKTLAVVGRGEAVGCVQKHDIVTESERKIEYQGTLMLGKLMTGFGVLRPECAVEIKSTS